MSALQQNLVVGASVRDDVVVAASSRERTITLPWQRLALGAIVALAAFLNLFQLDREGYGNSYYASAVRSMLQSWHNFFFVSFDPGGFVSIDKPPLGFWIETASAKLFGFNGISLLLPQALAGVLAVVVLYHLVARTFGAPAGLIAALALAVSPISVVGARSNNIDNQLVLVVLLTAWAVLRATETGRLRWLLLTAVLLGLGFNIKTMQAYLVLPACGLVYAIAAPNHWRTRIVHLALATVVLLVVSFWWIAAVDLTPASQRPYVGSSCTNSELNLALGYNGLGRLTGIRFTSCAASEAAQSGNSTTTGNATNGAQPGRGAFGGGGAFGNGEAGPFRLLNDQLGGQIGWLLPLAVLGLIVAALQTSVRELVDRRRLRLALDRRQQSLVLWGLWLATQVAFFSVAGFFHAYYLVMLAPAIAALAGIGAVALWQAYQRSDWRGWLLPPSLLIVAAVQAYLLMPYPDWNHWLTPLVVGLCLLASALLIAAKLRVRVGVKVALAAALVGLLALLMAPTTWAAYTVQQGTGGALGQAGPRAQGSFGGFGRGPGGFDGAGRRPGFGGFGNGAGSFAEPGNGFGGFGASRGNGTGGFAGMPGLGGPNGGGGRGDNGVQVNQQLVAYLEQHQGQTKFLVAVMNSMSADPYIITTGKPVMALGGFAGSDKIVTAAQLAQLVRNGSVRYFLMPGASGDRGGALPPQMLEQLPSAIRTQIEGRQGTRAGGRGGGFGRDNVNADLTTWVSTNCAAVPSSAYQATTGSNLSGGFGGFGGFGGGGNQLYDCASRPTGQVQAEPAIGQSQPAVNLAPTPGEVAAGPWSLPGRAPATGARI